MSVRERDLRDRGKKRKWGGGGRENLKKRKREGESRERERENVLFVPNEIEVLDRLHVSQHPQET